MIGIVNLPIVPLRISDNERAEMTSQLLFGEFVEILEMREKWLFVQNYADNYTGWIDRKMLNTHSVNVDNNPDKSEMYCTAYPIIECVNELNESVYLPGGSKLYQIDGNEVTVGGKIYIIDPIYLPQLEAVSGEVLVFLAKKYLNAPYLWGGKSIMGIDCSGFVQVIYDMCGIQLPRDASQQVECGNVIEFLTESQAGDLAFFENNEGKIIHVGLMINNHQIIHASGWVKIENIDSQGIISSDTGESTHKLRVVKRLIQKV